MRPNEILTKGLRLFTKAQRINRKERQGREEIKRKSLRTSRASRFKKVIMDCPECGAPDLLCKTRFDEFLVLEFTDTGYGAVHHLTVTAYMLQHSSQLTREGWLHERELLREFIIENKPPAFIHDAARL